ncbi:MAG: hypothetical protein ACI4SG_04335 [Oligosphaeraceae bacterium]
MVIPRPPLSPPATHLRRHARCLLLPAATPQEAESPKTEAVQEAPTVKQLRGKLLYKRNQIRKLEKAACEADAALQGKVTELESQLQALYLAAEPRLQALYQEEKTLLTQIQEATPKK